MSEDPRMSVTIADALMFPRQTGRARFSETVVAGIIADKTSADDMRVVVLVDGASKVFTGVSAIRWRNIIRQLNAAITRPEGEQHSG